MISPAINRRQMIQAAGALAASAILGAAPVSTPPAASAKPAACLFSKPLGNRKVTELPGVLNELGIDAVDLTCRGEGHVLPERVAEDLPRAFELLKQAGIGVPMITTEITDAGKGHAEAIVKTAAALGIRHAKLGYYLYESSRPVLQVLAEVKAKLRDVVALFKQYAVTAGYHNHSGMDVGAPMWDVWRLIDDLPKEAIGSYFDLGHATVEGGDGGWRIGLNLLLPRMTMVAVKDMKWEQDAKKNWRPRWGPLGEGMVRFPAAFARLKESGFAGAISLHVEYGPYGKAIGSADDEATLANIRRDWAYLRAQLGKAKLM